MDKTTEIRALSAEEINAVAGGWHFKIGNTQVTSTVTQTNSGSFTAYSNNGDVKAIGVQSNINLGLVI
jgi:hypothetical protein